MSIAGVSGTVAGSSAVTHHHLMANALKAYSSIIKLEPNEFKNILKKIEKPCIIISEGGFFSKSFKYLTSYKGLTFFCKSKEEIILPSNSEIIQSKKIIIPDI